MEHPSQHLDLQVRESGRRKPYVLLKERIGFATAAEPNLRVDVSTLGVHTDLWNS